MGNRTNELIYAVPSNYKRIARQTAKNNNITDLSISVLIYLSWYGSCTHEQLRAGLVISKARMLSTMTELVNKGFVDVDDSNKILVYNINSAGEYVMRGYALLIRRAIRG